jgi:hypothetical protein
MAKLTPLKNLVEIDNPFLVSSSNDRLLLGEGWSTPENDFTWTIGNIARLDMTLKAPISNPEVTVSCAPYTGGKVLTQPVMVFLNGLLISATELRSEIKIRGRATGTQNELNLVIVTPNAVAPAESGGHPGETRRLGVRVMSVLVNAGE